MAQGIGGGTRIGESPCDLQSLARARVIHSRTVVMIVSDGYEPASRHARPRDAALASAAAASSGSIR